MLMRIGSAAAGKRLVLKLLEMYVNSTKNTLDNDALELLVMVIDGDVTSKDVKKLRNK